MPFPHDDGLDAACQRLAQEPWTALAVLARAMGLPTERFRKVFKQRIGCSLSRYRVRCRIELARRPLHDPAPSVHAIARELVYANVNAFSACFRRETGLSPWAYPR